MTGILKFRPARPEDEPFFRKIRAQYDADRLQINNWAIQDEQQVKRMLEIQYKAHEAHYTEFKEMIETRDNVIELDGRSVGRFIVAGNKNEIRLADVLIDKQYRNKGIFQAIIDTTKAECAQSKRPMRLHTDKFGSLVQYFLKQGFQVIEKLGAHFFMEWRPGSISNQKI